MNKTYLPDDLSFYSDEASNDALQKAIENDIAYYKANPQHPPRPVFSESYEQKFKATLESFLGDDAASQVLAAREDNHRHVLTEEECQQQVQIYEKMLSEFKIKKGKARRRKSFRAAAAACFGVILLSVSVFGIKTNALKIPVGRFSESEEQDYVVLEAENDSESCPTTIEQKYLPGMVLDGYTEVVSDEQSLFVHLIYQNQEGKAYHFQQSVIETSTWLDIENVDAKECDSIFGDAFFYTKGKFNTFIWHYEGYFFSISGEITENEMIDVANSLQLQNED